MSLMHTGNTGETEHLVRTTLQHSQRKEKRCSAEKIMLIAGLFFGFAAVAVTVVAVVLHYPIAAQVFFAVFSVVGAAALLSFVIATIMKCRSPHAQAPRSRLTVDEGNPFD